MRRHRPGRALATAAVLSLLVAACGTSAAPSAKVSTTAPATTTTTATASSSPAARSGEATGVTPSQITVGNVSILSGPVPGLFAGAPYGAEAFFAYQDSLGGVDGRKIVVKSGDDGFSCTNNRSVTQSQASQVFAFVGSFSLFDSCSVDVFRSDPDLADVSETLDPEAQSLANNFQPQTDGNGWITGPLIWYQQHYPSAVRHVGALVSNVSSAVANWDHWKAAAEHVGFHVSYSREVNPLETDFTSDILRMRNAGVQFVEMFEDIKSIARILNAAQQQGWRPVVVSTPGEIYDNALLQSANPGAAAGVLSDQTQALYLGGDRKSIPEVDLFLTWMSRTHPGFSPDLYALYGWASARLFTEALKAAGPDPTRSALVSALRSIHTFNSKGILATSDPAGKKPPTCWIMVGVKNDRFYRVTPSSGFRCSPGGYFTS